MEGAKKEESKSNSNNINCVSLYFDEARMHFGTTGAFFIVYNLPTKKKKPVKEKRNHLAVFVVVPIDKPLTSPAQILEFLDVPDGKRPRYAHYKVVDITKMWIEHTKARVADSLGFMTVEDVRRCIGDYVEIEKPKTWTIVPEGKIWLTTIIKGYDTKNGNSNTRSIKDDTTYLCDRVPLTYDAWTLFAPSESKPRLFGMHSISLNNIMEHVEKSILPTVESSKVAAAVGESMVELVRTSPEKMDLQDGLCDPQSPMLELIKMHMRRLGVCQYIMENMVIAGEKRSTHAPEFRVRRCDQPQNILDREARLKSEQASAALAISCLLTPEMLKMARDIKGEPDCKNLEQLANALIMQSKQFVKEVYPAGQTSARNRTNKYPAMRAHASWIAKNYPERGFVVKEQKKTTEHSLHVKLDEMKGNLLFLTKEHRGAHTAGENMVADISCSLAASGMATGDVTKVLSIVEKSIQASLQKTAGEPIVSTFMSASVNTCKRKRTELESDIVRSAHSSPKKPRVGAGLDDINLDGFEFSTLPMAQNQAMDTEPDMSSLGFLTRDGMVSMQQPGGMSLNSPSFGAFGGQVENNMDQLNNWANNY